MPDLNPQQFTQRSLADVLHQELGYRRQHLESKSTRHPRSGYRVDVGQSRRVATPKQGEGPAEFNVIQHRMGQLPADVKVRTEPVKYVYRGMSHDEWNQAQERGHIQSDKRGVIADWEGTNAATDARSAVSYLPRGGSGVIAKIRVHPDDEWFTIPHDNYIRTRRPVPLDRVVRVSQPFHKNDLGGVYR